MGVSWESVWVYGSLFLVNFPSRGVESLRVVGFRLPNRLPIDSQKGVQRVLFRTSALP
jgi:hypothetical protein